MKTYVVIEYQVGGCVEEHYMSAESDGEAQSKFAMYFVANPYYRGSQLELHKVVQEEKTVCIKVG